MPISGRGWELHVVRSGEQRRGSAVRTIGQYRVYHDGAAVPGLSGATVEPGGPATNAEPDCGLRVEEGSYALSTHDGDVYCSIGYVTDAEPDGTRRPALRLSGTGARTDVLLHPGRGFIASLGCLNPASALINGAADIDFTDSRDRVIAIIADLERHTAGRYPTANGVPIPDARLVIEAASA